MRWRLTATHPSPGKSDASFLLILTKDFIVGVEVIAELSVPALIVIEAVWT